MWTPVRAAVRDNSIKVEDLVEGRRYLFRVAAVNAIGKSEPAETLTSIVAKNPFGEIIISEANNAYKS